MMRFCDAEKFLVRVSRVPVVYSGPEGGRNK